MFFENEFEKLKVIPDININAGTSISIESAMNHFGKYASHNQKVVWIRSIQSVAIPLKKSIL